MKDRYYAHSRSERPSEDWHRLEDHLIKVAKMARTFADDFRAGKWGYLAGLWHDLGKYSKEFQDRLKKGNNIDANIETTPGRVDHSSAGAHHAVRMLPILGHLLAYAVAGHHSGLLKGRDTGTCQDVRLSKTIHPWEHGLQFLPSFTEVEPPILLKNALSKRDAFSVAFFIRMIFSCLVDADFLDTEAFMNPQQAALRENWPDKVLEQLWSEGSVFGF